LTLDRPDSTLTWFEQMACIHFHTVTLPRQLCHARAAREPTAVARGSQQKSQNRSWSSSLGGAGQCEAPLHCSFPAGRLEVPFQWHHSTAIRVKEPAKNERRECQFDTTFRAERGGAEVATPLDSCPETAYLFGYNRRSSACHQEFCVPSGSLLAVGQRFASLPLQQGRVYAPEEIPARS